MAYYDDSIEKDQLDPNAAQNTAQTGPQSGVISGQGSSTVSSSPSAAPKPTNAPDNPGNFVGIQQYLDQNKPQAAKLAQNVGDYVSGQGVKAQGALDEGQNKFNQDVTQNTVNLNQDLFNKAKSTPEEVAADQAKKSEFIKMRDAQYKGPTSLEGSDYYQPINLAVQNALGTADKTNSTLGRSELMTDIQKQNNQKVSRGAANLDSALLSVSPDSKTILSQARGSIAPLDQKLKDAAAADALKASQAADQTAKTQKAIQDAFAGPNGVQSQIESSVKSRADQSSQMADKTSGDILNKLKSGDKNISDNELKLLGLTRNQYLGLVNDQEFYKSRNQHTPLDDLSSFATRQMGQNQITPQNVASDEDYAKYSALNELMGTSNGFLNDPTQAGKANLDTIDYNYAATPSALADRINSTRVAPLFPDTQDATKFDEINSRFNLDSGKKLGGVWDLANSLSSYPDSYKPYYDNMLNGLKTSLNSVNGAYGTHLQVPKSYMDRANKAVRDGMAQILANPNLVSGGVKRAPSDLDYQQAAQIAAYTTFLNDLSKDNSKVRAGNPQAGFNL